MLRRGAARQRGVRMDQAPMKRASTRSPLRRPLVLLLCFLLRPTVCHAVERDPSRPEPERFTIATSLVTPFFGAYYLEGKVNAASAFGVLLNTSYLSLDEHDWKVRSGTAGIGLDYYFQGRALRRWYAEAVAEVWFCSWRHESPAAVAPVVLGYAGVALVGYQFVFDAGPVLDVGAGAVAFHVPSAQVGGSLAPPEAITKLYPAAKVNVGWAF